MDNSASHAQLEDVAAQCIHYTPESQESGLGMSLAVSCNSCANWDGERCTINVFDKVLSSFDQG